MSMIGSAMMDTVRVFVSYRRTDSRHATGRLRAHLASEFGRDNVFYDVDSLGFGSDFRMEIHRTLQHVDALIVVIGPNFDVGRLAQTNDYVRMEILEALRLEKQIIPVLVDDALIPTPESLPRELEALSFRTAAPLRPDPDFDHDVARLVDDLRSSHDDRVPPDAPGGRQSDNRLRPDQSSSPSPRHDQHPSPPRRHETDRRRVPLWPFVALVVVLAGAAVATFLLSKTKSEDSGTATTVVTPDDSEPAATTLTTADQSVAETTQPSTQPSPVAGASAAGTTSNSSEPTAQTVTSALTPLDLGEPSTACRSLLGRGQPPERVEFDRGAESQIVSGVLQAGTADIFVLDVAAGQQFVLETITQPQSAPLLCVATGVGAQILVADMRFSLQTGAVPAGQDYFVLIAAPVALSYTLEIEIPPLP